MDLSVIIVNWNTRDLLQLCLSSCLVGQTGLDYEIIVIDNGSVDGSAAMVNDKFPQVKLIRNQHNLGFCAANNQGLRLAQSRYVLLLNSDTQVWPQTFSKLVKYADSQPRSGVIGCHLVNPDGSDQWSVRRFPQVIDQIIILTKLANFWPKLLNRYLMADFDYRQANNVDQVMGAAMLIRQEVLSDIGLLDERFWSWFEDVDFCYRARAADWLVSYTPSATIRHDKGQSFAQHQSLTKQKIWLKSLWYYLTKHHSPLARIVVAPFAVLSLGLAAGVGWFGWRKKNQQL